MKSLPYEIKLYILKFIGSPTGKIIKEAFNDELYLSYVPKIKRLKRELSLFNDLDPIYMNSNTYGDGKIIRINLAFKDHIVFGPYVGIL